jgi:hypothetical protein
LVNEAVRNPRAPQITAPFRKARTSSSGWAGAVPESHAVAARTIAVCTSAISASGLARPTTMDAVEAGEVRSRFR